MRTLALLLIGAMGVPTVAAAQTAAFKCPAARIVVEHSDTGAVTWTGKTAPNACETITKRPDGTETVNWFYAPTAIIPARQSQAWATQAKTVEIWPLTVGKKVNSRYDGVGAGGFDGTWYYTFSVDRAERLTTAAGAFDTFVVTRQEDGKIGSFNYKSTLRHWYAPELAVTVKFEYSDNQGRNLRGEATKITR